MIKTFSRLSETFPVEKVLPDQYRKETQLHKARENQSMEVD